MSWLQDVDDKFDKLKVGGCYLSSTKQVWVLSLTKAPRPIKSVFRR